MKGYIDIDIKTKDKTSPMKNKESNCSQYKENPSIR